MRAALPALLLAAGTGAHAAEAPAIVPPPAAVSAIMAEPCVLAHEPGNDWPALCHYHDANRAVSERPRAVLIGDSITEFWLPTAPALFAAGIVDRGISGQTCTQIAARFYQDVVRLHPRVVHIMCGTNDIAGNMGPESPDDFANAMLAMVDLAKTNGIAVVVGSVLPAGAFGWRAGYRPAAQIVAFNTWLRDLAQQKGLVYADYHGALDDGTGAIRPGLAVDGVHPNAAGYALMAPITRAAIEAAERSAPKP